MSKVDEPGVTLSVKRGKESVGYFSFVFGVITTIVVALIAFIPDEILRWYFRITASVVLVGLVFYFCFFNDKFRNFIIGIFVKIHNHIEVGGSARLSWKGSIFRVMSCLKKALEFVTVIIGVFGFLYLFIGNGRVEVLDVTPVLVEEESFTTPVGENSSITETPRGASFILHIRNNSSWKKARISRAMVEGRIHQPYCYIPPNGSYLFDPKIQEEKMQWYQKLSDVSDIYEGINDFPIVEPKSDVWLKLDFLYPSTLNSGVIYGEECCRDGMQVCEERSYITWEDFYDMTTRDTVVIQLKANGEEESRSMRKAGTDLKLRNEWENKELHFKIQTIPVVPIRSWGQHIIEIGYEKIHEPIKITKQEWLDLSARELSFRPAF